jgi:hypothetical protein
MIHKFGLFLMLTISGSGIAFSQTLDITGSVKNEKRNPLPFALVLDIQANSGIYSDSIGNFKISVKPGTTIKFSLNGYSDTAIVVQNNASLQVILRSQANPQTGPVSSTVNTPSPNITVSDAFSGTTYANSTYNSSGSEAGGLDEASFNNGSFFPVSREKEEVHGSRYLFKNWSTGTVLNSKGIMVNNSTYLFNYDKIDGNLLLTHDQKNAIIVDKDQIRSFTIFDQDKKPILFESYPAIDSSHFLEVLVEGIKYKIFKLIKTKLIKANYSTNGIVDTGNPYDEFIDNNIYYLVHVPDNQVTKFSLRKKSIREAFEEEKNKIDRFFNKNSDTIDDQFLINLGTFMNS